MTARRMNRTAPKMAVKQINIGPFESTFACSMLKNFGPDFIGPGSLVHLSNLTMRWKGNGMLLVWKFNDV